MNVTVINKPVLCMYDVTGIQEYVFRTNKLKEVIGASQIIESLMEKGIEAIYEEVFGNKVKKAIVDWDKEFQFDDNADILMEVVFIGGGNAFILFRNYDQAIAFNRKLSKWILENTYSLQLAIAIVNKTENYYDDYQEINKEMRIVKSHKPQATPVGNFAVTAVDGETGFPVYKIERENNENIALSRESLLKRKAYENLEPEEKEGKHLDALVSEKGIDSNLAFVHIDGNSMGQRIARLMIGKEESCYKGAVERIREISRTISTAFVGSYNDMVEKYERTYHQRRKMIGKGNVDNPAFRKVIVAGDDITFICNASVAFSAVKYFIEEVAKKKMSEEKGTDYSFSACAGIAFANSHFPFSDAYTVAEACCASAKKRAKKEENRFGANKDFIGSWIDFQICDHIGVGDLKEFREKNYRCADGSRLLKRPYCIGLGKGKENDQLDFVSFLKNIDELDNMPRSRVKKFRDTYQLGKVAMESLCTQAATRNIFLPGDIYKGTTEGKVAEFFDALEIADYYIDYD